MSFSSASIFAQLTKHRRLIEWCRLFVGYSVVQAIGQGLGFLTGIIVVRTLSKENYAFFMIVSTIGPLINTLSDTGITNSLAAVGGKFWQDDGRMGSLVRTAMMLRHRLVVISVLVVSPFLTWMLWHNHASWAIIVSLVSLTIVGVYFQLNAGVLFVVISLRQQVRRMQVLVFAGVLPRLVLISLFAALGWLNTPLTVGMGTIAMAVYFWRLKSWVKPQIAWNAPPDPENRKAILAIVKRQAPQVIYFCVQSQISVWLISIFGNVHRVAEVAALGRIGMIFSILFSTASAVVVPRFARCQEPDRLRSHYTFILSGFTGIILLGTGFSLLAPRPLLWLLGPQYSQLGSLVWLAVLAAGTWALAGLIYSLNVNKGWISAAAVVIPAEILTQIILCLSFDLSSVRGMLMIAVIAPIVPALINIFVGIRKLKALDRSKSELIHNQPQAPDTRRSEDILPNATGEIKLKKVRD